MRPPEGLEDWFDKMEQEQLSMLDQPGGWNTRSRRYRVTFAISMTVLHIGAVVVLNAYVFNGHGIWNWVFSGVLSMAIVAWFWILAFDPARAVRVSNWRGKKLDS